MYFNIDLVYMVALCLLPFVIVEVVTRRESHDDFNPWAVILLVLTAGHMTSLNFYLNVMVTFLGCLISFLVILHYTLGIFRYDATTKQIIIIEDLED